MKASKEIVDLFNQYRQHVGNQHPEAAAMLTLAQVIRESGTIGVTAEHIKEASKEAQNEQVR